MSSTAGTWYIVLHEGRGDLGETDMVAACMAGPGIMMVRWPYLYLSR